MSSSINGSLLVPNWYTHVHVVLEFVVPHQQFLSSNDVPCCLKIEVVIMLQGLEVLLLFASSTLDEVHPVTIFGVTSIYIVYQACISVHLYNIEVAGYVQQKVRYISSMQSN